MGIYIDPTDGRTKEKWLADNGVVIQVDERSFKDAKSADRVLVCLVDNGHFKAAGVMYNAEEFEYWFGSQPSDPRPRVWYSVFNEDLFDGTSGVSPF